MPNQVPASVKILSQSGVDLTFSRGPHPLAAHLVASWHAAQDADDPFVALSRFHTALGQYQSHPHHRAMEDPPTLVHLGTTRVLDYGPSDGRPLLVVPSLINPAWILDLTPQTSLLRWLSRNGIRPLLVDWGVPGSEELQFDLDDYILKRLVSVLDVFEDKIDVMGYCLGGTLSLALAHFRPHLVRSLVLLATPWDMAGYAQEQRLRIEALWHHWQGLGGMLGALPMELVQLLFLGLDPAVTFKKFMHFATLDPHSPAAFNFVVLEDWANAGAPLALPTARQLLSDWLVRGGPAHGWTVRGEGISLPQSPVMIAIATGDRIVPAAVARPLAAQVPHAQVHSIEAGHVGMLIGSRREALLWQPIRDFLEERQKE